MVLTDKYTNQQVLGCLMKNPLLLVNHEVKVEDFGTNKVAKIIFISIRNLFESGAKTLTPIEIDQDIERYEASATIYKQEKGLEVLKECYEISQEANFVYYYERLKKLTLLRVLGKKGYDISPYYKKEFDTLKEENETITRFDEATIDDILNYVEGNYNRIKQDFLNGRKEDEQAAKGIDELIDSLLAQPEIGVPICGNMYNTAMMGGRLGKFYVRSAASGAGKRIADYTPIPTPSGWRTVGDIKVGDYIFGKNGKPTKVLNIYKNVEKIWKITFADGRTIDCCGEHLWEYYAQGHNGFVKRVENTQTIYNRAQQLKNGFKDSCKYGWRFKIPINEAVEYSEKQFYPSPYIMGLILGDGNFRYNKSQKAFSFSSSNEELSQYIADFLKCKLKKSYEENYNWYFQFTNEKKQRKNVWVEEILKNYPELWNKKSEEKFIPKDFLMGSVEQRLELLKGLLDTDGSIDLKGRINFTTISSQLAQNVIELCHSLGMITHLRIDTHRDYKASNGKCYCVHIQCAKDKKTFLFNLSNKKERAEQYTKNGKRQNSKDRLSIVNIEPLEEETPMTCFTVDAEDALYQVGDFIVTHNTRLAVFDACKICFPSYWSFETHCFVKEVQEDGHIRKPRKTLLITTELAKDEIQTMILAYLSGVNEAHILMGNYIEGELERVRFAARIMKKYQDYLYVDEISDPNLTNIQASIRKFATIEKVKYVFC